MADDGWKAQPKRMNNEIQAAVVEKLKVLWLEQQTPMSIVLHGGEPLLLGKTALNDFCQELRRVLPKPNGIHLQTNGLLLDDETLDILVEHQVGISISLDGPAQVHDKNRVDLHGAGSYERIRSNISLLVSRPDAAELFAGVLAVIDPTSDPLEVYKTLKDTGAPSIDFLYRDGNHQALPEGKVGLDSTEYGVWLGRIFEIYMADPNPPRVRVLDDLLRLILGGVSTKEGVGGTDYGILVVETDGSIAKNDTLKASFNQADRFAQTFSVLTNSFREVLETDGYTSYYTQQGDVSVVCQVCPEISVCGGGMVAHRWSLEREYDNPTVFCADQLLVIAKLRSFVTARLALAVPEKV
jgi:uncharacterized protein